MSSMTPSEIRAFLQEPRHAIVGTNRAQGAPQLSPVWYLYRREEDRLYISVGTETAKHHNLLRDPHISLCIDGCHPDARAVMIYGTAELVGGDDPASKEMRRRIIRQYHDTEQEARRYYDQIRDQPFVLLIVTPQTIIGQDFN
jgi:PPOX class probable F420-dependent enzyme